MTFSKSESLRRSGLGVRSMLIVLVAFALLMTAFSSDVEARRRRGRGRSAAAAAKARKAQMIKTIQQQVAAAQKVLSAAESQAAMSGDQVKQALSQLSGIRTEIESAHENVAEAATTLREIEAEILAEQKSDSPLELAKKDLRRAQEAVHLTIHAVLDLPNHHEHSGERGRLADLASISSSERATLGDDARYHASLRELNEAARRVKELREALFEGDPEWVAAQRALADAQQRSRESTQQAQTAGLGSLGDRQNLHNAQQIAATARAIIAQGETRLRQLGAKPTSNSKSTSRSTKSK